MSTEVMIEYGADVDRKYRKSDDKSDEPLISFAKPYSEMAKLLLAVRREQ